MKVRCWIDCFENELNNICAYNTALKSDITQYNKRVNQQKNKMSRSSLQKRRNSQKIGSTCLSIEHPLAFSIQLKPNNQNSQLTSNAQSCITSPNSKSQHLKISRYSQNGLKQADAKVRIKRAFSASVPGSGSAAGTSNQPLSSTEHVKALSNKFFNSWSFNNESQNCEKQDIKWIGVHINPKNSQPSHNQAFPKRQQKNADQSFANFILRYGRLLKHSNQVKNIVTFSQVSKGNQLPFKGATTKVKPRLTWFEKKKNIESIGNKNRWQNIQRNQSSKSEIEVVWWKDNN